MSKTDDGGPAFPVTWDFVDGETGMSLRDWFAGQALAGLAAMDADCGPAGLASDAYRLADAMLAARSKRHD
jgi:hypothetical protein